MRPLKSSLVWTPSEPRSLTHHPQHESKWETTGEAWGQEESPLSLGPWPMCTHQRRDPKGERGQSHPA